MLFDFFFNMKSNLVVIIAIQRLESHKWLEHVLAGDGEADKTNTYGS